MKEKIGHDKFEEQLSKTSKGDFTSVYLEGFIKNAAGIVGTDWPYWVSLYVHGKEVTVIIEDDDKRDIIAFVQVDFHG